jgi:hypothetical protein
LLTCAIEKNVLQVRTDELVVYSLAGDNFSSQPDVNKIHVSPNQACVIQTCQPTAKVSVQQTSPSETVVCPNLVQPTPIAPVHLTPSNETVVSPNLIELSPCVTTPVHHAAPDDSAVLSNLVSEPNVMTPVHWPVVSAASKSTPFAPPDATPVDSVIPRTELASPCSDLPIVTSASSAIESSEARSSVSQVFIFSLPYALL